MTKQETLKDHAFNCGSAKNASEYATSEKYTLNYIRRTYKEANDIATAMQTGNDMDFNAIAPKVKPLSIDAIPGKMR